MDNILTAEQLIKVQKEYIEFLTKEFNGISGYLYVRGLTTPFDVVQTSHKLRSQIAKEDLIRLRNYFGENDKTEFEHWAFSFLDKITKEASPIQTMSEEAIAFFEFAKSTDLYYDFCVSRGKTEEYFKHNP